MARLFNDGAKFMFADVAAADYLGTGAIHVPVFEKEILDRTHKRGSLMQRLKTKLATGHPTRYFEKVAHDNKSAFINPRGINHALDTEIKRVEHPAYIRALVDGITFTKFDQEVTMQQGLYTGLKGEDLEEMVTDMLAKQDEAIWNGKAKSLIDGDSTEYCGLLTQIKKTATIAKDARLTVAVKDAVAELMYNKQYRVKPTAIYMNPLDLSTLENQELEAKDKVKFYDVEVVAGIKVNGIMTGAGILPLITDIFCPKGKIVITDETLLERQYVTSATPRIYQMGTEKDLAERYIAILFDTFIVRGANYGHEILNIDGATV